MRWATITDNKTSLTINAWNPSDACQVIQQQLHHLKDDTVKGVTKQALEVSRQQGDVDGRGLTEKGIRHLKKICICVPSTGMGENYSAFINWWGDPAEQLLSPEAWAKLLMDMSRQWKIRADKLEIKWDKSCTISVKGLLDILLQGDTQYHLRLLLTEREGGWRDVRVYIHDLNTSELGEWNRQYQKQQSLISVGLVDKG